MFVLSLLLSSISSETTTKVKNKIATAGRVYFFSQIKSTAVVNTINSIILKSESTYLINDGEMASVIVSVSTGRTA